MGLPFEVSPPAVPRWDRPDLIGASSAGHRPSYSRHPETLAPGPGTGVRPQPGWADVPLGRGWRMGSGVVRALRSGARLGAAPIASWARGQVPSRDLGRSWYDGLTAKVLRCAGWSSARSRETPCTSQAVKGPEARHATRRFRYAVAVSLDGFIAGPNGEADWIVIDPELDFDELNSRFDTMLMGRRTYEAMTATGGGGSTLGMRVFVVTRTLRQEDHPDVTIVDNLGALVAELRSTPGKDVWLFGGGSLFRSLVGLGVVDIVEVGVIPVLLGEGVPLLPAPSPRLTLILTGHKVYARTGTVFLEYAVNYGRGSKHGRT